MVSKSTFVMRTMKTMVSTCIPLHQERLSIPSPLIRLRPQQRSNQRQQRNAGANKSRMNQSCNFAFSEIMRYPRSPFSQAANFGARNELRTKGNKERLKQTGSEQVRAAI
jgi:hypothetical protein